MMKQVDVNLIEEWKGLFWNVCKTFKLLEDEKI